MPVSAVMLNGICVAGVVPALLARVPFIVTVMVVTAVSQTQVAWFAPGTALHWMVAVVPSWSWMETVPVVAPFIFSLKVTVKASPASTKSVLGPALFDMRASIIVGGVKSAAPVVKVVQAVQFARSLPAMSWISF